MARLGRAARANCRRRARHRPGFDPIQAWEESDSEASAAADIRQGRRPTAPKLRGSYDGFDFLRSETPMNAKQLTASFATVSLVATLGLVACERTKSTASNEQPATVGQKIDNAIDKTSQKISEAGDKTLQTLNEAGKKTEQALSSAGEKISAKTSEVASSISASDKTPVTTTGNATTTTTTSETKRAVSDAAITASVKTDLLKDPDLSVLKIDVDTKDGVVTLNGLAADEPARSRAEKMASAVKGVKEVRNFLVVKRA